jgi:hypothetical protein
VPKVKNEVIQMIERLPDDAGIADIMAELYFRLKVETRPEGVGRGQGHHADRRPRPTQEVAQLVWSPSASLSVPAH